jgi:hypothetical protein
MLIVWLGCNETSTVGTPPALRRRGTAQNRHCPLLPPDRLLVRDVAEVTILLFSTGLNH